MFGRSERRRSVAALRIVALQFLLMDDSLPRFSWLPVFVALAIVAATAAILLGMGRVPFCSCGTVRLWANEVYSTENSQQIADWYTPSHIVHGFLFYWFFWLIGRRWPQSLRFTLALLLEAAWEIAENTNAVIDRYRSATASLNYLGDSVLNSVSDIVAMMAGYGLAAIFPVWLSVVTVLALELVCLWAIRDNLTLNVIMLLRPVEAIKTWQLEIAPKP
jgi:hypothetical protein